MLWGLQEMIETLHTKGCESSQQYERLYNRMFNFEIHVMKGILNLETVNPLKCVSARLLKEAPELPLGYRDD